MWLNSPDIVPQEQSDSAPQNVDLEEDNSRSSVTSSSDYDKECNREDLFLPLPNHCLSFINEKESSDGKRFKRLKCSMCKRNTHHRCIPCNKAFCKDCAFKKHIQMNKHYLPCEYRVFISKRLTNT